MAKKGQAKANANHKGNQGNANKGTKGVNPAYAAVHHNRARQMDPKQS